jgi:hypothetical protein
MATRDTLWARRRVNATGQVVGLAAVITATAIVLGAQLASSPSAIADNGDRPQPTFGGVGIGAKPTAIVSGVANPTTGAEYLGSLNGAYNTMNNSLQAISQALQAQDWDSVKSGCGALANSGQQFKNTLPSPDSRATFRMQDAVDEIANASNVCMTLGPASTQDDLNHMMSSINDANLDFKTVKQILVPAHS